MFNDGLKSLIGDGGLLDSAAKLGDKLDATVSRAAGWKSLSGTSAPPPARALPTPSGGRTLSQGGGIGGVVIAGSLALVALVIWAIKGR